MPKPISVMEHLTEFHQKLSSTALAVIEKGDGSCRVQRVRFFPETDEGGCGMAETWDCRCLIEAKGIISEQRKPGELVYLLQVEGARTSAWYLTGDGLSPFFDGSHIERWPFTAPLQRNK